MPPYLISPKSSFVSLSSPSSTRTVPVWQPQRAFFHQPVRKPFTQPVCQVSQPVSHPVRHPVSHPTNQSVSQTISQSVSQASLYVQSYAQIKYTRRTFNKNLQKFTTENTYNISTKINTGNTQNINKTNSNKHRNTQIRTLC
jgi:hypothetical protein